MECCGKIRSHHCKVVLLDDQELIQEIRDTSLGQEVLDTVFRHLNLLETSYFGLRYIDTENQTHWLDTTKRVTKQLKGKETFTLYFGVKFYAADPCKLVEEITRYQFFLQVKQDILQGRLPVPFDLAAELGAYLVQSELGDFDPRRHSPGYVSEFRFVSNQTLELENKIADIHKDLVGQQPSVAELNYLEKVKWLEMYGVDLHPVLGEDNTEYFLGLTPTGVIVLRNKNKVANYYWPRITKIYHKGKYFMLRVCDKNNDENTYGFETPSKSACKHLYKCCVEHNAFFRLVQVSPNPPDLIGSSGQRDKTVRGSQLRLRNTPQFVRTPSRRYQRRIVEGAQDPPKIQEKPIKSETCLVTDDRKPFTFNHQPQPRLKRSESPRSTRSAPPARGLYTSSSPRSLRSAGQIRTSSSRRSASLESRSSNESKSCRRHRHHSRRRGSDNESEASKCSGKSRRRRNRSRHSSGSDRDGRRHRNSSKQRYEFVDSSEQWKEVLRKQAEGGQVQRARIVSSKKLQSEHMNKDKETDLTHHSRSHRHRKHRSRSRSPTDGKPRLPEELKRHLEFSLIETEGMSESQLKEIPYKVVETNSAKAVRVKLSPTTKKKPPSMKRSKSCSLKDEVPPAVPESGDSPPPPYCENPSQQIPRTSFSGVPSDQVQLSGSSLNRSLCSALYGNPMNHKGNFSNSSQEKSWINSDTSKRQEVPVHSSLSSTYTSQRPLPFSCIRQQNILRADDWLPTDYHGTGWPLLNTYCPSSINYGTLPENFSIRRSAPHQYTKQNQNSSNQKHSQGLPPPININWQNLEHEISGSFNIQGIAPRKNGNSSSLSKSIYTSNGVTSSFESKAAGCNGNKETHASEEKAQEQSSAQNQEKGPLFYTQAYDDQKNFHPISKVEASSKDEVNNNPGILHEMSTEL